MANHPGVSVFSSAGSMPRTPAPRDCGNDCAPPGCFASYRCRTAYRLVEQTSESGRGRGRTQHLGGILAHSILAPRDFLKGSDTPRSAECSAGSNRVLPVPTADP